MPRECTSARTRAELSCSGSLSLSSPNRRYTPNPTSWPFRDFAPSPKPCEAYLSHRRQRDGKHEIGDQTAGRKGTHNRSFPRAHHARGEQQKKSKANGQKRQHTTITHSPHHTRDERHRHEHPPRIAVPRMRLPCRRTQPQTEKNFANKCGGRRTAVNA